MNSTFNIVFLIGLPRSGTTLLQRLLARHSAIRTTTEPWFLLPLSQLLIPGAMKAWYSHKSAQFATSKFVAESPSGEEVYARAAGQMVETLYRNRCVDGETYFLDKTPRYYGVLPFLDRAFPDARFIFLFRNPLSVVASVAHAWHAGRFRFGEHYIDLVEGPKQVAAGFEILGGRSMAVEYEDLIKDPQRELSRICGYLGLEFRPEMLAEDDNYAVGDQHLMSPGTQDYESVSAAPAEKWLRYFNSRTKRTWARKYLSQSCAGYLRHTGETLESLMARVDTIPANPLLSLMHAYDRLVDRAYRTTETPLLKSKVRQLLAREVQYPLT